MRRLMILSLTLLTLCHCSGFAGVKTFGRSARSTDLTEGLYVGTDFLWFKACVDDLHYATIGSAAAGTTLNTTSLARIQTNYDPGIRVYGGWENLVDCYGLEISYLFIHTRAKSAATGAVTDSVQPSMGVPMPFSKAERAASAWSLRYRMLEGRFDRALACSSDGCYGFKVWLGGRAMQLDQERTDSIIEEDDAVLANNDTLTIARKYNFTGAGPAMGFDFDTKLCGGLSLRARVGGSIMLGERENYELIDIISATGVTSASEIFATTDDGACFPGINFMAGLSWLTHYCDICVDFRIGYEFQQFINAIGPLSYDSNWHGIQSSNQHPNIALHGLYAGVGIYF